MLTREECLFALESLKPADIYEFKEKGYLPFTEANSILTQLIEEHFEVIKEKELLEEALDKACELLEEQTEEGNLLCPCEYLGICHCMSTENGYECNGDNDYKWKEVLMKDVD